MGFLQLRDGGRRRRMLFVFKFHFPPSELKPILRANLDLVPFNQAPVSTHGPAVGLGPCPEHGLEDGLRLNLASKDLKFLSSRDEGKRGDLGFRDSLGDR